MSRVAQAPRSVLAGASAEVRAAYQRALTAETTHPAPDARRVIRAERQQIHVALQRGDGAGALAAAREADRVVAMWAQVTS